MARAIFLDIDGVLNTGLELQDFYPKDEVFLDKLEYLKMNGDIMSYSSASSLVIVTLYEFKVGDIFDWSLIDDFCGYGPITLTGSDKKNRAAWEDCVRDATKEDITKLGYGIKEDSLGENTLSGLCDYLTFVNNAPSEKGNYVFSEEKLKKLVVVEEPFDFLWFKDVGLSPIPDLGEEGCDNIFNIEVSNFGFGDILDNVGLGDLYTKLKEELVKVNQAPPKSLANFAPGEIPRLWDLHKPHKLRKSIQAYSIFYGEYFEDYWGECDAEFHFSDTIFPSDLRLVIEDFFQRNSLGPKENNEGSRATGILEPHNPTSSLMDSSPPPPVTFETSNEVNVEVQNPPSPGERGKE